MHKLDGNGPGQDGHSADGSDKNGGSVDHTYKKGTLASLARIVKLPAIALRRMYGWTIHWAGTKQAPYALFGIAFAESSFFPVPPDVLLIPMVVARRNRWFRNALICTLGSVCGALLGYLIGWAFYESVGRKVVEAYDLHHAMQSIGQKYSQNAFLTVLTAAFTPIPYKVITIGAGLFKVSLPMLVLGSAVGRAGRFFLVAGLLRVFGERMSTFIEKYFDILSLAFAALLIGGFLVIKYLL